MNWLLTGGIGSGKTEVRRVLAGHGLMTIDADSVGHEVLSPGGPAVDAVAERWPDCVVDGVVDRRLLGARVFASSEELQELERITHPHIFEEISRKVAEATGPVVVEIPVLKKPAGTAWRVLVVDAPDEIRRQRAVDRGAAVADVDRRMAVQPTRSEYLVAADVVLPNTGSVDDLERGTGRFVTHLIKIHG